jgi:hypothetical protein
LTFPALPGVLLHLVPMHNVFGASGLRLADVCALLMAGTQEIAVANTTAETRLHISTDPRK